ncbi:MAG: TetR/AcrR family transcriptional regulator [Eubacteriales bacterium]
MNKKAQKILETTVKLFIRDGIKKITMDDIAKYSKSSKVTVYKYFVDKDTLFLEVSKYIFFNYTERLKSIITSHDMLIKKLYRFLDVISDFSDSKELELCRELSGYNNIIEAEYETYLQTYRHTLLTLINYGIENGLIKGNMDTEIIYRYIDMGVVYYQQCAEYRKIINNDSGFKKRFMLFYISNIFVDGEKILSAI